MELRKPTELILDPWQERVLRHKGNMALRCGRQTGKSTAVSYKARQLAWEYPGTTTLIIAPALRQSQALYSKVRALLEQDDAKATEKIKRENFKNVTEYRAAKKEKSIFVREPTQTTINMKNGSNIVCHPCGDTGAKIRFLTVDFLIPDEAQGIPDEVWIAVIPMMATSKKMRGTGWIIMLGTPKGKRGFFFDVFDSSEYQDFMKIHVSAEKCLRISKVFLRKQKKRWTKMQYRQEYLAEFVESHDQYFPTKLIKSCAVLEMQKKPVREGKYYLGVDFARFGGDQNAFVVVEMMSSGDLHAIWIETQERVNTLQPIGKVQELDKLWNFKRIFVDSGGLGGPILDILKERLGRKVVGLDNATRSIEEDKKTRILKEDLYANAITLMENKQVKMVKDWRLGASLKSISFEYGDGERVKIKGKGSHLCEAFVRATWCLKDRGLSIFLG